MGRTKYRICPGGGVSVDPQSTTDEAQRVLGPYEAGGAPAPPRNPKMGTSNKKDK